MYYLSRRPRFPAFIGPAGPRAVPGLSATRGL